jgi:hypothetical protein
MHSDTKKNEWHILRDTNHRTKHRLQSTGGNVNISQSVQRTIKSKLHYNTIRTTGGHHWSAPNILELAGIANFYDILLHFTYQCI